MLYICCIFVQDLKLEVMIIKTKGGFKAILKKKKVMTYKEWCSKLQWLKDKVILPNGTSLSKADFITKDGFNIESFNELLYSLYEKDNKLKPDGRRYKK